MESDPHREKARPTGEYQPHGHNSHSKPSNSDLLSSAKVLADAVMHRGENDFDKEKVADAAADILHAASEYGKFEDKPMGKMVGKAEDYLHQYHSSTTTTTHPAVGGGHSTTTTTTTSYETTHSSNLPDKEDHGHGHSSGGGGGYGDYMKMAEGLFNKNSGSSGHGSGGATAHSSENSSGEGENKYGDYIKMAEGVFSKYNEGDAHNSSNTTTGDAHSGGGQHGNSGGGYGDYAKMAGDFLKKH